MKDFFDRISAGLWSLHADPAATEAAEANIREWMTREETREYRTLVESLVAQNNWAELIDCFYRILPFGTGGRRGAVGVGPNRINPVTFDLSVQGHCDYLLSRGQVAGALSVVLAWDVREFSDTRNIYAGKSGILDRMTSLDLARSAAEIYAGNGISAWSVGPMIDESIEYHLTKDYISTPELSFLIRRLGASGGLNISASHNPPDDNGGKVYNASGGQEVPPDDETLLRFVEQVTTVKRTPYTEARKAGLIRFVSAEDREKYIQMNAALCPSNSRSARIAFTPLNGVGSQSLYRALKLLGFHVQRVEEEFPFDGSFPHIKYHSGNPEIPEVLDNLKRTMIDHRCDLGLATDPDADRLGALVAGGKGAPRFFNGNELGAVLLQSRISEARRNRTLSASSIFINTVVTSSLQRLIARQNGLQVIGDLMVGFKYMGNVLRSLEESGQYPPAGPSPGMDHAVASPSDLIFTTEEAHGFLLSPEVRDKDACGAGVHLAGLSSQLRDSDRDLIGYLRNIYRVYGYHASVGRSLVMEGLEGIRRMSRIQTKLRETPPERIAGMRVTGMIDHQKTGGPIRSESDATSRNVLQFHLEDKDGQPVRLVVRPSGTEPKTKIYVEVVSPRSLGGVLDGTSDEKLNEISDVELDNIINDTDRLARSVGDGVLLYCLGDEVLGDIYTELPKEMLAIPDIVPVDRKVAYCTQVLPKLREKLKEEAGWRNWLEAEQRRVLGPDGVSLADRATAEWLDREGLSAEGFTAPSR